jgi:Tol biopolymer transport system component
MRSSRTRLAILALAAGLVIIASASVQAAFPGPDGRIAFWDFNTGQIYAIDPDGSDLVQLTHVPHVRTAADPAWSPDGKRIVFDSDQSGRARLWTMNADGSDPRQLAGDSRRAGDLTPTFTPDGRRIVFSRCKRFGEATPCGIFSISSDGSDRRQLTAIHPPPREVFDFRPSVSPDGSRIAFARFNNNHGIFSQIFVIAAAGSGAHAVTPPKLEGWAPSWSPDGRRIAFSTASARPGSNVYTMRPDGSHRRRLTAERFPNNGFQPAYSPAGDDIVFASDRRHSDLCCNDLFEMSSDGTGETFVHTGLTGILDPSWGTAPTIP